MLLVNFRISRPHQVPALKNGIGIDYFFAANVFSPVI